MHMQYAWQIALLGQYDRVSALPELEANPEMNELCTDNDNRKSTFNPLNHQRGAIDRYYSNAVIPESQALFELTAS